LTTLIWFRAPVSWTTLLRTSRCGREGKWRDPTNLHRAAHIPRHLYRSRSLRFARYTAAWRMVLTWTTTLPLPSRLLRSRVYWLDILASRAAFQRKQQWPRFDYLFVLLGVAGGSTVRSPFARHSVSPRSWRLLNTLFGRFLHAPSICRQNKRAAHSAAFLPALRCAYWTCTTCQDCRYSSWFAVTRRRRKRDAAVGDLQAN